jgi:uncharacterized protein YbjT (DUF2867 family)
MLLVTGPTGNVGAEVAKLMIQERPVPFRLAAHNPDKLKKLYGDDIPVCQFSYDDRSTWDALIEGVDTVFLLFPLPNPRNINHWMTPFIDKLVEHQVKHIIYLAVPGSDKQKIVPHYSVERHIEASGIPYTFLHCTYFMQNFCRGISTHGIDIVDHHELFIPAADGKMTVVDARDVAEVVRNIVLDPSAHQNRTYTLNGPENIDMYEVADALTDALGYKVTYTRPSPAHFIGRMIKRHVKWDVILFMTIVYRLTRQGSNAQSTDDLEKLLGRPPRTIRDFTHEEKWRWETRTWT